ACRMQVELVGNAAAPGTGGIGDLGTEQIFRGLVIALDDGAIDGGRRARGQSGTGRTQGEKDFSTAKLVSHLPSHYDWPHSIMNYTNGEKERRGSTGARAEDLQRATRNHGEAVARGGDLVRAQARVHH